MGKSIRSKEKKRWRSKARAEWAGPDAAKKLKKTVAKMRRNLARQAEPGTTRTIAVLRAALSNRDGDVDADAHAAAIKAAMEGGGASRMGDGAGDGGSRRAKRAPGPGAPFVFGRDGAQREVYVSDDEDEAAAAGMTAAELAAGIERGEGVLAAEAAADAAAGAGAMDVVTEEDGTGPESIGTKKQRRAERRAARKGKCLNDGTSKKSRQKKKKKRSKKFFRF